MHRAQVIAGGFFLAKAFGLLFMRTFESVIQVCILGNPAVVAKGMAGAVTYLPTCDEQIDMLTNGWNLPLLVIFLGSVVPGAWFVFTGLQSRSLIGMKKET